MSSFRLRRLTNIRWLVPEIRSDTILLVHELYRIHIQLRGMVQEGCVEDTYLRHMRQQ